MLPSENGNDLQGETYGRALIPLLFSACATDRAEPALQAARPAPPPSALGEAPLGCVPGASAEVGDIPTTVVVQSSTVVEGAARVWRVHADGRYDWTYGRPLPLDPDDPSTWYAAPPLDAAAVERIRAVVATRLPTMVSFEPEHPSMHVPGRRGFDAPGVGSAWYTGPCETEAYRALVKELDALLDADGRPRSQIRERGGR